MWMYTYIKSVSFCLGYITSNWDERTSGCVDLIHTLTLTPKLTSHHARLADRTHTPKLTPKLSYFMLWPTVTPPTPTHQTAWLQRLHKCQLFSRETWCPTSTKFREAEYTTKRNYIQLKIMQLHHSLLVHVFFNIYQLCAQMTIIA